MDNLKGVKFCENCKRLFRDDDKDINGSYTKDIGVGHGTFKRSMSANIRQRNESKDSSFVTDFPIVKVNELRVVNKDNAVVKNLFDEFNKFESNDTQKSKDNLSYQENNTNISIKAENIGYKGSISDNESNIKLTDNEDPKYSNKCSNDTKKHELPENNIAFPKTFMTFDNSIGIRSAQSDKNTIIHSINSGDSKEQKTISDRKIKFNECKGLDSGTRCSKFKNMINEVIYSDKNNCKHSEKIKKTNHVITSTDLEYIKITDLDIMVNADNEKPYSGDTIPSSPSYILTPQFSINKENPQHINDYINNKTLINNNNVKEVGVPLNVINHKNRQIDIETEIRSDKKLNFEKKHYIELKLDTAEKLMQNNILEKDSPKHLYDMTKIQNVEGIDKADNRIDNLLISKISTAKDDVKQFFTALNQTQIKNNEVIFEAPQNIITPNENNGFCPESPDFNNKTSIQYTLKDKESIDYMKCSLEYNTIKIDMNTTNNEGKENNNFHTARSNSYTPMKNEWYIDKQKIISFSNIDNYIEPPQIIGNLEEAITEKKDNIVQFNIPVADKEREKIPEIIYDKNPVKDSFLDSKIKFMLLSNIGQSGSKQKVPRQSRTFSNNFQDKQIENIDMKIKQVTDDDKNNHKNIHQLENKLLIENRKVIVEANSKELLCTIANKIEIGKGNIKEEGLNGNYNTSENKKEIPKQFNNMSLVNDKNIDSAEDEASEVDKMLMQYHTNTEDFIKTVINPSIHYNLNAYDMDAIYYNDEAPNLINNKNETPFENYLNLNDNKVLERTQYKTNKKSIITDDVDKNLLKQYKLDMNNIKSTCTGYENKEEMGNNFTNKWIQSLRNIDQYANNKPQKSISYQNFFICTQNKNDQYDKYENNNKFVEKQRNNFTIDFNNNEEIEVHLKKLNKDNMDDGAISPIPRKQSHIGMTRKSNVDLNFDCRNITLNTSEINIYDDQTLVDVVHKIDIDASQINRVQDISLVNRKENIDCDIEYIEVQGSEKLSKGEYLLNLVELEKQRIDRLSIAKATKIIDNKYKTERIKEVDTDEDKINNNKKLKPLVGTINKTVTHEYRRSKYELSKPEFKILFETRIDEQSQHDENDLLDYDNINYKNDYNNYNFPIIEVDISDSNLNNQNGTNQLTNKWLRKTSSKPRDPIKTCITPVNRIISKQTPIEQSTPIGKNSSTSKMYSKAVQNISLCHKYNKKASLKPKNTKKYSNLYQKQKVASTKYHGNHYDVRHIEVDLSDSDIKLLDANQYYLHKSNKDSSSNYPYLTDKKVITIKKSEIVYNKVIPDEWNKENTKEGRKVYHDPHCFEDENGKLDTEQIRLKNDYLLKQIEEIEKSLKK